MQERIVYTYISKEEGVCVLSLYRTEGRAVGGSLKSYISQEVLGPGACGVLNSLLTPPNR